MFSTNSSYFGGKNGNGTYQNIINEIPECKVFVDAMVGGGGVFKNLNLPGLTVINDIDCSVIDKYVFEGLSSNVKIYNDHYKNVVNVYDSYDTVVYFDPPYHFDTRKSKNNMYFLEWGTCDHVDFLQYVKELKSKVIISHYPFGLYDDFLRDWRVKDFNSVTQSGVAVERLYMNFDVPKYLQDYRYIGCDYIDRQRIKRQNKRLIDKINSLPLHQRSFLIKQISNLDL